MARKGYFLSSCLKLLRASLTVFDFYQGRRTVSLLYSLVFYGLKNRCLRSLMWFFLEGIHLAFGGEVFDTEARLYGLSATIAGVLFLPRISANFPETWASLFLGLL